MGVLAELFSRPLHRDGMRGDVLLVPPLGYARTPYADEFGEIDDSPWYQPAAPTERAILGNKREQAAASMRGVRERRNAEPAAANAQRVLALLDRGPQNRRSLLQGLGLRAGVLDAALAHLAEAGLAEVEHKREHPKGGKLGAWWRRRAANHEPAAPVPYGYLQAPPGGAQLGGRPYHAGQFIPGNTLFTHAAPRRADDIRPGAPVPYAPVPGLEPENGPGMGVGGQAADGTYPGASPAAPQLAPGGPQNPAGTPMAPQPGQPPAAPPNGGLAAGAPVADRPQYAGPALARNPNLPPDQQILEAQSQTFAMTNYPALRTAYLAGDPARGIPPAARIDPVSGDVRTLTLDSEAWSGMFPGYTGTNGAALTAAAAFLNNSLFREALRNQAGKGNNTLAIVAGGGGAGAGSALRDLYETGEYPLVVDETNRPAAGLSAQIEAAQAAGLTPEFTYVDRPPGAAAGSIVEQALEARKTGQQGRTKPIEAALRDNLAARRAALNVLYAHPNVRARVVASEGTARFERKMITDPRHAAAYLAQRVAADEAAAPREAARLRADVLARYRAGEIPVDVVTGLLGEGWDVRPPAPVAPRRPGY